MKTPKTLFNAAMWPFKQWYKFDVWLCNHIELAYLWLFDLTGIKVGHVMSLCAVAMAPFALNPRFPKNDTVFVIFNVMGLPMVAVFLTVGIWWTRMSDTHRDIIASFMRSTIAAIGMRGFVWIMLANFIGLMKWNDVITQLCIILVYYLVCVYSRPRNPDRFKRHSLSPSMG